MNNEVTVLVDPTEWGGTERYETRLRRMVPTIVPGMTIGFDIFLNLGEVRFSLKRRAVGESMIQLLGIDDRTAFYWFCGKVSRIRRGLFYHGRNPGVLVRLESSLPVFFEGVLCSGERLEFREGDVIAGAGHLLGAVARPRFGRAFSLKGKVTKVRPLKPSSNRGHHEVHYMLTIRTLQSRNRS